MMMGELPSKHNLQQFHWNLALQPSNRYPTAQIFLIFLQSLMTGNSTNSRPIQTDSFNTWTKTWESNTKREANTTRIIKSWMMIHLYENGWYLKIPFGPLGQPAGKNIKSEYMKCIKILKSEQRAQICKKRVVEKIERDRESLYRKWKEPEGKILSMSLLIFSKRLNKRNIFCHVSSSFHIFVVCFSYFVFLFFSIFIFSYFEMA